MAREGAVGAPVHHGAATFNRAAEVRVVAAGSSDETTPPVSDPPPRSLEAQRARHDEHGFSQDKPLTLVRGSRVTPSRGGSDVAYTACQALGSSRARHIGRRVPPTVRWGRDDLAGGAGIRRWSFGLMGYVTGARRSPAQAARSDRHRYR